MNLFFSVNINEILIRIFVFDSHRTLFAVYEEYMKKCANIYLLVIYMTLRLFPSKISFLLQASLFDYIYSRQQV
jgi:hypothetical protein